jgi:hypothetical protein
VPPALAQSSEICFPRSFKGKLHPSIHRRPVLPITSHTIQRNVEICRSYIALQETTPLQIASADVCFVCTFTPRSGPTLSGPGVTTHCLSAKRGLRVDTAH